MGIDGMNSADIFDEYFDDEKPKYIIKNSEIEKMNENAGVKFIIGVHCRAKTGDGCKSRCSVCDYNTKPKEYPPFTAEKQLEIVKAISTNHISGDYSYKYLGIDRDEIEKEIYLNLCIDGKKYHAHDKDFGIALAKLVNLIWQDLTDQERTEIADILKG